MPSDIKLNKTTWDYDLTTNGMQLHDDNPEVVAQRLRIAYQLKQGELFTDIIEGVPIMDFSSSKDGGSFADAFMINYTQQIEGVDEVISFSSSLDAQTRIYTPVVQVRTTAGDIITVDGST